MIALIIISQAAAFALNSQAQQAIDRGAAAAKADNWLLAVTCFDEALRLAPDDARILFNLGVAHDKAGHALPAIVWLRAYLIANPQPQNRAAIEAGIDNLTTSVQSNISRLLTSANAITGKLNDKDKAMILPLIKTATARVSADSISRSPQPSSNRASPAKLDIWIAFARAISQESRCVDMEGAFREAANDSATFIPMGISNIAVRMHDDLEKILVLDGSHAAPPTLSLVSVVAITEPVAIVRVQGPSGLVEKYDAASPLRLSIPAGKYTMIASRDGYAHAVEIAELSPGAPRTFSLRLGPGSGASQVTQEEIVAAMSGTSAGIISSGAQSASQFHTNVISSADAPFGQGMQVREGFFTPPPNVPVFGLAVPSPLVITAVEPSKREIILGDVAQGAQKDFAPATWTLRGTGFQKGASLAEENEEAGIADGERKSTLTGPETSEGFTWMSDEFGFEVISSTEARLTMFRGVIKNDGLAGDYVEKDRFYIRNPDGAKSNVAEFSWIMHGRIGAPPPPPPPPSRGVIRITNIRFDPPEVDRGEQTKLTYDVTYEGSQKINIMSEASWGDRRLNPITRYAQEIAPGGRFKFEWILTVDAPRQEGNTLNIVATGEHIVKLWAGPDQMKGIPERPAPIQIDVDPVTAEATFIIKPARNGGGGNGDIAGLTFSDYRFDPEQCMQDQIPSVVRLLFAVTNSSSNRRLAGPLECQTRIIVSNLGEVFKSTVVNETIMLPELAPGQRTHVGFNAVAAVRDLPTPPRYDIGRLGFAVEITMRGNEQKGDATFYQGQQRPGLINALEQVTPDPITLDMAGTRTRQFSGVVNTLRGRSFYDGIEIRHVVGGRSVSMMFVGKPFSFTSGLVSEEYPFVYSYSGNVVLISATEIRVVFDQLEIKWMDPIFSVPVQVSWSYSMENNRQSLGHISTWLHINPESGEDGEVWEGD